MIHKKLIEITPEEQEYENYVLNPWQRLVIGIWRFRVNRAFDARDKHAIGTWQWVKANDKVERFFL
jgi:hypothetical protein